MFTVLRLAVSLARLTAAERARRMAVVAGLWALAAVFLLIGIAGFAAALWIWLQRHLDPLQAALVMGAGGVVLALIVVLVARARVARPVASPLAAELQAAFADSKGGVAVWAPLIGLMILGFVLGAKTKD